MEARGSLQRHVDRRLHPEAPDFGLYSRIVCGVDETPESLLAVTQARHLRDPVGTVLLLAVCDSSIAVHGGWAGTDIERQMRSDLGASLTQAAELLPGVETKLVDGEPTRTILNVAERRNADLIAVGTHGRSRAAGIALGTVGTTVLHEAECSVFFARPPLFLHEYPASVLVGIDGSLESRAALEVGREIAARSGAVLRTVFAGSEGDAVAARLVEPELVVDHREPVEALCALGADADLLVVGSRGVHGIRALGSVSERVAHRAPCSVLVVRPRPR
jgi:nucleotide-binding universal stress UspA family protein